MTSAGTAALKYTFGAGTYSVDAVFTGNNALQGGVSTAHALTVTGNGLVLTGSQLMASGSVGNYTLVDQIEALGGAPLVGTISFLDTSDSNALVGTATLDTATLAYGMTPLEESSLTEDESLGNVVTGDFNNDGILDFALINNNDGPVVSVFVGNGDGSFQEEVNYALTSFGADLKVGDFNGDGKLDLVTVSPCDCETSVVSVLLGNGDGTFQSATTYTVGPAAFSVAVGDFNGDGIQDLVTANEEGNNVSVLLGNGNGTFQAQVQYAAGVDPIYVTVGDLNGDGVLDVAVVNRGSNTLSVLLGNGDGTFQPQVTYSVGGEPVYILAADFNKDGKLDLAVSNQDDDTVSVLLGVGDGTFLPQVTYATGNDPQDLAVGDLNQDGNLDLLVTNNGAGSIGTFYGNRDGTFQTQVVVSLGDSSPWGIATGDFNGDGLTDVVEADEDEGAIVLYGYKSETATATGISVSGTGTHNIAASYPGDASRMANLSSTVALTGSSVPPTVTTTTLVATPNPAIVGQTVTLTATVVPAPTGDPFGNVNFYAGEPLLGTGMVNSAGVATATTAALPVGSDSIGATYSGNRRTATSSSTTVTETITPLTVTTTTLVIAPSPPTDGQMETFTATVAPAPTGVSLGTVDFYNGVTLLGMGTLNSSGIATFTSSGLPSGAVSITAVFSGNATSATSTSAATMVTVAPGFTVVGPQAPVTVPEGGLATFPLTVPPLGGTFPLPVTLSASGLPPGATAVFTPPIVTPGATGAPVVLTIQLPTTTAFVTPSGRRMPVWPGLALALSLCVMCSIVLAVRSLPRKMRLALACTGMAAAVFVVAGCNGAPPGPPITPGNYIVTITGTSGSLHSSTTVTIHVQ